MIKSSGLCIRLKFLLLMSVYISVVLLLLCPNFSATTVILVSYSKDAHNAHHLQSLLYLRTIYRPRTYPPSHPTYPAPAHQPYRTPRPPAPSPNVQPPQPLRQTPACCGPGAVSRYAHHRQRTTQYDPPPHRRY